MEAISAKELIPYLKTAMELESSIYSQELSINTAKYNLEHNQPKIKKVNHPKKKTPPKPSLPQKADPIGCGPCIIGMIGAVLFLFGVIELIGSRFIVGGIRIVIGGIPAFFYFVSLYKRSAENARNEEIYNEELRRYENEVEKCEKEYQKNLRKYEEDCTRAEKDYQHQLSLFKDAQDAVSLLEKPLQETRESLEKLYQIGWIFPKYQNFVAICSFNEYFLTGRCSELTGPNGAYNLYESELRQNIIINKLDTIINRLDSIKNNQYLLYRELEKTNTLVSQVNSDVMGIYSETIQISNASHIAASCAETSAKNTEALKYIALINAAK